MNSFFHRHFASEPPKWLIQVRLGATALIRGMAAEWMTNISHCRESRKLALRLLLEPDTKELFLRALENTWAPRNVAYLLCFILAIKVKGDFASKWVLGGGWQKKSSGERDLNADIACHKCTRREKEDLKLILTYMLLLLPGQVRFNWQCLPPGS